MLRTVTTFFACSLIFNSSVTFATGTARLLQHSKFVESKTFKQLPINPQDLTLDVNDCPDIFSKELQGVGRQTMENILICHALKESGNFTKIQYILSGNTDRQRLDVANNKGDMLGHSISEFGFTGSSFFKREDFIISQPVIKKDQISYWIFTSRNQTNTVKAQLDANNITQLVGVSMLSWRAAIQAMELAGLKLIKKVTVPEQISETLEAQKANFTLSTKNKPTLDRGTILQRVEGYRIANNYHRVFAFNKSSFDIAQAIETYFTKLRSDGDKISLAFKHAKYLTKISQNWKVIR